MDISSYLSELILTHKAIGIAGLGTVYKKKLPGRYDAATHSFIPPSYTLDFTPELREEEILTSHISKTRNVSADTASYFINEFSESILADLNDQQDAQLGELGKLVKSSGQLIFEPSAGINYGFDFYGLPSIEAGEESKAGTSLSTDAKEQQSAAKKQESPAEEIIPETPPVEEPVIEIPVIEEPAAEEITDEEPASSISVIEEIEIDEVEIKEPIAEEQLIPKPEEVQTMESVIAANEKLEENPGDQISSEIIPPVKKDEQQLRAEIEALNFYRSKTPAEIATAPEKEEVIWNINQTENKNITAADPLLNTPFNYDLPQEEESRKTPLYLSLLMALLILMVLMAIAYFVKPEWFNGIKGTAPVTSEQKIQPAVTVPADTITESTRIADSVNASLTPATVSKDSLAKSALPVKPADTATVYEIIGASMHDQKEADAFIAQMKKSGITAKVVTNMSGKRLKMSIATLKDQESANLELDRLAKKLKIEGIYIYRNKQH